MYSRLFAAGMAVLVLSGPAPAGIFRKTPKPDPAIHVPGLIQTLKTSKDEKARASAAAELRDYDAKAFPDILPTLMAALANDPSSSVRSKAAESIGAARPITPEAGHALEMALDNDRSWSVKIAARTALVKYRVLGFIGSGKGEMTVQTAEPPLAAGGPIKGTPGGTILRPTPTPIPATGPVSPPSSLTPASPPLPTGTRGFAPRPQSGEPPLAEPGRPAYPVLTSQPKAPAPIITIPSPSRDATRPIPGGPLLPAPRPLPNEVNAPAEKPSTVQGPTLPPRPIK